MAEPLTYRTRYDTILFVAGAFAFGVALAVLYLAMILSVQKSPYGGKFAIPFEFYDISGFAIAARARRWLAWDALWLLGAISCGLVLLALALAWQRLTVGEDGLNYRTLLRRKRFPWDEIQGMRLQGGVFGLFFSPRVVLSVEPGPSVMGEMTTCLQPCLSGFLNDLEGLIRQIAAHAPHARLSSGVQAYLNAPHRVSWRHRLPILFAQLVAISVVVAALADTWLYGMPRYSLRAWIPLAPLMAAVVGGAVDRQWRWKWALVAAAAPLVAAQQFGQIPAVLFGRADFLVAGYAGCLAWMLVAFAVCLPWRPRGRHVASALAAMVLAATVVGWNLARSEPLPSRRTQRLPTNIGEIKWSLDGRLVCAVSDEWTSWATGTTALYAVDPKGLLLRERCIPGSLFFALAGSPDGRHVACVMITGNRPNNWELWVWDTADDTARPVHADERIELRAEGAFSPDHRRVAFRAGHSDGTQRLYVLDLGDGSVTKVGEWGNFSDFESPCWRADGALLLTEKRRPSSPETCNDEVALWLLQPGRPEPRLVRRMTGDRPQASISPCGRWGVLWDEGGPRTRTELLDLSVLRQLSLPGQLRHWWPNAWLSDGRLLLTNDGERAFLDLSSGKLSPAGWAIDVAPSLMCEDAPDPCSPTVSFDGRHVADIRHFWLFEARHRRSYPMNSVRILDTHSGRAFDLRQSWPLVAWTSLPVWSPVSQTCVMARYDSLIPSDRPVLCFYDLEGGERAKPSR
ncbi:MAG TPA: PH domain-containing protein [Planctomycetota bacterium]|nr:PH domain-containing protein [Planctomycetota bacterium]